MLLYHTLRVTAEIYSWLSNSSEVGGNSHDSKAHDCLAKVATLR